MKKRKPRTFEEQIINWIASGDEKFFEVYIEKNLNINAPLDQMKFTPLHRAVFIQNPDDEKNIKFLQKLLSYRHIEVDSKDIHNQTPLQRAASCGNVRAIRFLIEHGADYTVKDFEDDNIVGILRSHKFQESIVDEVEEILKKADKNKKINESSIQKRKSYFSNTESTLPQNIIETQKKAETLSDAGVIKNAMKLVYSFFHSDSDKYQVEKDDSRSSLLSNYETKKRI